MTVRFLETVDSAVPGFPFMPGQVIRLTGMTPEVRTWLANGRVELLRDTEPERAVAVASRGKRKTERATA